jgi:hypothetical protein
VKGIVIVCRDITARKQAETDLQKAYNDAKRRARANMGKLERTKAYLEAEIRQRQQAEIAVRDREAELRKLRQMKQRLEAGWPHAVNLAHELRDIISVVRLRLETVLAHPEQADWEELERSLLEEIRRAHQILDESLKQDARDWYTRP